MTTASYYLWKWADNDLSGPPDEVFADLLRGKLHPAVQPFDARPVIHDLQALAGSHRPLGVEWDWQVLPGKQPSQAHALFLQCPVIPTLGTFSKQFATIAYRWGLSGYDEQRAKLIDSLLAKKNALVFRWGTGKEEEKYDISATALPALLSRLESHQLDSCYADFWNHLNHRVACIPKSGGFEVEWRVMPDPKDLNNWDQWRAGHPLPSGIKPRSWRAYEERVSSDWNFHTVRVRQFDNELISFADMVEIFSAFARNEPRPAKFQWRSLRQELSETKKTNQRLL